MGIFGDNAPRYWAAGLPVIPLRENDKRPAISGWQIFGDVLPNADQQRAWLAEFDNGNIGMPLGVQSGLIAVDIDTDDERVLAILDRMLPPSPWKRVGKKGEVRIYRYSGERTTRVRANSGMLFEVLANGAQIVLPPSIHPDTGRAYVANAELWEVAKTAPVLGHGFVEKVLAALRSEGIEGLHGGKGSGGVGKVLNFVPAGTRDNAMVGMAGLLARGVVRGERSLLEALAEMSTWVENYVEQVVGDPLKVEKGHKKIVEFLIKDVTGPRQAVLPRGWDEGLDAGMKAELGVDFSEDKIVLGGADLLSRIMAIYQMHPEVLCDEQMAIVQEAMARIAREDNGIGPLEEERILRFIVSQSAGQITMSALRRQIKTLKQGEILGENHDEIARAVMEWLSEYGELRFDMGRFWQWNGAYWTEKQEDEIIRVISSEFGFYPTCRRHGDYVAVSKLLRSLVARKLKGLEVDGVNFANGFLTENLDLLEHSPEFGATYVLPYRYLPEMAEKMELFNAFMVESWGQDQDFQDKVCALQEAMGATLFGMSWKYQRAVCLMGPGGSGKSTCSKIVRSLLPDGSISAIPPEKWGDTFLPAEMAGKLMNFAGELSEKHRIPGQHFKQIVEGEEITGQFKNQNPFRFHPYCSQWFNSNHLPKSDDTSSGFTRRWLFIEFPRAVPADKIIPDLDSIIVLEEREAIVAWAILGYERLRRQGKYTEPGSHKGLVRQLSSQINSVFFWLTSTADLLVGKDKTQMQLSVNDLYRDYWSFCLSMGVQSKAQATVFIKMMRDLQYSLDFEVVERIMSNGAVSVEVRGIAFRNGKKR